MQRLWLGRLRRYLFLRQPVNMLPKMPRGFSARLVPENDPVLNFIVPSPNVRHDRLAQSAVCLAAFREAEPVGSLWLAFGQYAEDEVHASYRFGSALAWDFGLEIPVAHRGGRAFQAVWAGAREYLMSRSITATLSRVTDNNQASLKAHARMGAVVTGSATFISIKKQQLTISGSLTGSPVRLASADFRFDR